MTILLNPKPSNTGLSGAGATGSHVIEVDERNFQKEVVERSRTTPVVIDFWAPWCGPCRTLGPILEKLAAEGKGSWVLAKVNVDNNQRLAQAFGVQGIPAVKAVSDGRLAEEFTGALPESQVRAWLQRFVPPSAEQAAEDLAALAARDPKTAQQRYRAILATDPKNDDARLGLGRILVQDGDAEGRDLLQGIALGTPSYAQAQAWLTLATYSDEADPQAAFELLGRVDEDPTDLQARYELAALKVGGRRYDEAIDLLLDIIARNRAFQDDA
ncbi:MAG: tetratricopeptide repeat protein, partial [Roseiflexaceae bacterium]|nr:tetratricopeptide repeat protein [Roseiflexaceae bacterium]